MSVHTGLVGGPWGALEQKALDLPDEPAPRCGQVFRNLVCGCLIGHVPRIATAETEGRHEGNEVSDHHAFPIPDSVEA